MKGVRGAEMKIDRTEVAMRTIERTVRYFVKVVPGLLRDNAVEDLVQEVYCHFLEKAFFQKYDGKITSFEYFVARAAKNYLIDIARKGFEPSESLDETLGHETEDGATKKGDMVAGGMMDQFSYVLLHQMMESTPETQISPNYDLTWRQLLKLLLEGYTVTELHKIVGISSGRISQLKSQLEEMLRAKFQVALAL